MTRRKDHEEFAEDVSNEPSERASGMQTQGDLNPQRKKDQVDTAKERNARAASEAVETDVPGPRFDDDGNPIDAHGRHRQLDPGEAPMDGVERSSYTVGKGGVTVRGKVYVEGDLVELSEQEANQILDMGNQVTHSDPVEAKAIAERRAERDNTRKEKHAERLDAAREEAQAE